MVVQEMSDEEAPIQVFCIILIFVINACPQNMYPS